MPKLDPIEHKKRKEAGALRCLDKNGKPLNEASKSVAVQDKKQSCDVNNIVARVLKNGTVDPSLLKTPGRFGDFTSVPDFQESLNRINRMNEQFMSLPAVIRAKFDNDPAKLIAYLDQTKKDPKIKEEAIQLGILPKPVIKHSRLETPEGNFWITTKDDVEIARNPIKPVAPTP